MARRICGAVFPVTPFLAAACLHRKMCCGRRHRTGHRALVRSARVRWFCCRWRTARSRDPGNDMSFMSEFWSHCPAGTAVVALLRAVWIKLNADDGGHE